MITDLTFWLIVWGIIAALGVTLACSLIGTGKGQHKGDRAPFRKREAAVTVHMEFGGDDGPPWAAADLAPLPDMLSAPLAQVTAPLHPTAVLTPAQAAQVRDPSDDTLWNMCRIEPGPAVWAVLALEAGAR